MYIFTVYDDRGPEYDQDELKHIAWVTTCLKYVK